MPKGPILLLENDLELIENTKTTFYQIRKSIRLLSKHNAIQVRLRSRFDPGEPFVGVLKYKKCIEEERLQAKINPNTYEGGTQEFIELLELEGVLPDKFGTRLNTNIKINSKVWEGKFIDLYNDYGPALTRPDLNYLGWESSFDG